MAPRLGSFRYNLKQNKSKLRLNYTALSSSDDSSSDDDEASPSYAARRLGRWVAAKWREVKGAAAAVEEFVQSDPRNVVFAAKLALALVLLVVLLVSLQNPLKIDLTHYAVWAVMTVVVVFEFSIGATLNRGSNRALGTLSAGGLALGVAELSKLAEPWDELVIVGGIFVTGFTATFIRLHPIMKPYEYGLRIFLVTFCLVMASGYRTKQFIVTAVSRFIVIALGAAVGLGVNICIYPFWAGEDLHNSVVKNFTSVAKSLEGCVNGYLQCLEYERVPSKILTYQASDDPVYSGYRSAVESNSNEDALLSFAIWEPPHGPYKMLKYPWKSYVKVSGALRHCAFVIMTLHGCLLSEIQGNHSATATEQPLDLSYVVVVTRAANCTHGTHDLLCSPAIVKCRMQELNKIEAPREMRHVFSMELQRVGSEGAKVLRELGKKMKTMTKLGPVDVLLEVHEAAEELQKKIDRRSYLLVNSECWEIGSRPEVVKDTSNDLTIQERAKRVVFKSLSETLLDLRSFDIPTSSDICNSLNTRVDSRPITVRSPNDQILERQISCPTRRSSDFDEAPIQVESKTYESASALSLATFSSLLIEFVARLHNVVAAFEELSEKADFKEPVDEPVVESAKLWTKLSNFLVSK